MDDVKLLSEPTNYAIVHLPGRRFPGVVFQGDSLNILIADLERIKGTDDRTEARATLQDVIERLREVRVRYEAVLNREEISLPYFRP